MFHILLEVADELLHDALAAYTMIGIKDPSRKEEVDPKKRLVRSILHDADNFKDQESVQRIIDEYGPIVKSLYT